MIRNKKIENPVTLFTFSLLLIFSSQATAKNLNSGQFRNIDTSVGLANSSKENLKTKKTKMRKSIFARLALPNEVIPTEIEHKALDDVKLQNIIFSLQERLKNRWNRSLSTGVN